VGHKKPTWPPEARSRKGPRW